MLSKLPMGSTPKLQTVCAEIHQIAVELGPGARLPTAVELRERTGVSMATLNSALKELEAQNVVNRKHGVGIYVSRTLGEKSVSLLCDPTFFKAGHSPFWDTLLEVAQVRAVSHSERCEMHFALPRGTFDDPLQGGLMRDMAQGLVHGIIGVGLAESAARWINAQGMPFVALFGPGYGPRSVMIRLDEDQFMRLGLQTLHAAGCQRIAVWGASTPERPDRTSYLDQRIERWSQLFAEVGVPFEPSRIDDNRHLLSENGLTTLTIQEQGFETAQRVFSAPREEWPDGLIVTNDMMTHSALLALSRMDVEVGRDFQLVSHANKGSAVLLGHSAPMTLLEYDPAQVVEAAFENLEILMTGATLPHRNVYLAPTLREITA